MRIRIGDKIYENDCREFEYYDDLIKLQKLMEDLGFPKLDLNEIEKMWSTISDKYFAQWLGVPCDIDTLVVYLSEIEIK